MSEVEKMYELAGVEKVCKIHTIDWQSFKEYYYPPFTAEKQLELVKWCCKKCRRFYIYNINDIDNFAENLAKEFNHYWQDLTSEEQEQIRSILNG